MRLMDEQYTKYPSSGSRTMWGILKDAGYVVSRKRIQRLMKKMGLIAIYPKPRTTQVNPGHKKYPYLLRGLKIDYPNKVWCTDITYLRMREGFIYLNAVMDWHSRYVLSWKLSNTLDADFCLEALGEAFNEGYPEIFNTDQGAQFTCEAFTSKLENANVKISMDGKGRWMDNVFIERLWRSVKYDLVYLKEFQSVSELFYALEEYFVYYNKSRPHQALNYKSPFYVYKNLEKNKAL
jgi:putative transposase